MPTLDTVTDRPDVTDETRYLGGYPYADFDALRDEDPVQWYRRPGFEPFWAVTGLAEVAHVSRHPELFSSAQRVTLDPPDAIEMIEADIDGRAAMFGHDRNDAPALSYMDAPRHRELRRVMAPFFSVRAVAALEERFVGLARGYADDFRATLAADGTADVATGLTNRLPVAAICEMVGVPEGDREDVLAWTEGLVGCADPEQQLPGEDAAATFQRNMMALGGYLAEHVRRTDGAAGRRRHDRRTRVGRGRRGGHWPITRCSTPCRTCSSPATARRATRWPPGSAPCWSTPTSCAALRRTTP